MSGTALLRRPYSSQLALTTLVLVALGSLCVGASGWVLTVTVLPEWFSLPWPVLWLTGACVALSLASVNFMCWERLLARGVLQQVVNGCRSSLARPSTFLCLLLGVVLWTVATVFLGWTTLPALALAVAASLIALRASAWITVAWQRWNGQKHQSLHWQNDLKLAYAMLASVVAYAMGHEWFDAWLQGAASLHLPSTMLPVWLAVSTLAAVSFWGVSAERASTFIDTTLARRHRSGTSRVARLRWWLGTLSTPSAFLLFVGWVGLPDMGVSVTWWALLPLAMVPLLYLGWNMLNNVTCLVTTARMPWCQEINGQHWHLHYRGIPVDRVSLLLLRLAQQSDDAVGAAALPIHVAGEGAVPANGAKLAGLGPWMAMGVFGTHALNDYVQDKMTCEDGRAQPEPLTSWVHRQFDGELTDEDPPRLREWSIQPLTAERLQAWRKARTQRYCTLALLTLLGVGVGVMGVGYWQLPWWGGVALATGLAFGAAAVLKTLSVAWHARERQQWSQRLRQAASWSTARWALVTGVGALSGFATGAYGGVEFSNMLNLPLVCVVVVALCGLLVESKFYDHFLRGMFGVDDHHHDGDKAHHREPSPLRDALVQNPLAWYQQVANTKVACDDTSDDHDHSVQLFTQVVQHGCLVSPPQVGSP